MMVVMGNDDDGEMERQVLVLSLLPCTKDVQRMQW